MNKRWAVKVEDLTPEERAKQKHERLMNHVVLPRYLPQEKSPHLHEEELSLLTHIAETVESLSDFIPANTLTMMRKMNRVHRSLTPDSITTEIRSLKPGETFAMFVRRHNTAFMIYALPNDEEHAIVATFPGNVHPEAVYGNQGDLQVCIQEIYLR